MYSIIMDYLLMGAASVVIIALICWYITYTKSNQSKKTARPLQNVKCPLCESNLFKGENIISKVYRPMNVPDQLMTVSGCPHCYPKCEPGVKRICPVCHSEVSQNGTLTARLFNKQHQKKHVHILGCSNCRKKRD